VKLNMRPRDRRALILLVLGLSIYGFAQLVILPAYDRLMASGELAVEKEAQLKRYRRAQLRKGQYGELLKLASDRVTKSDAAVIGAANLPLASAEMQSSVEAVAAKVGLMPEQRAMGTPRRLNDFYAELSMTLTFTATPGQLVSFLNELRTQPRFLTVRSLQMTPLQPVMEAPKGVDVTKSMRVNMSVVAFCPADLVKTGNGAK